MKQTLLGIIVGLLIGGAVVWTYEQRQHPPEKPKEKAGEHKQESIVQHGTNGETFLKLTKEVREHVGLKTQPLEKADLSPELKAYGKVLDPTPLATLLIDQTTAKASLDASSKEYERLKQLFAAGQNASARAVEAAEAMMKKDRIQLDAIQSRLALALGPEAASKFELPKMVESLLQLKTALVRMDVPLTEKLPGRPIGARIASASSEAEFTDAVYLGPAASVDPQLQGQGFIFLVQSNPPPPGAFVMGWLKLPGEAESGVMVPREAVVRHEGEAFVYVQKGDDVFVRQELELERPLGKGWFVDKGLKPKENIVVEGAQQLLSEEFKDEAAAE